jgi:hypothetical protein
MAAYELSAGDYSGWKYWRTTLDRQRLVVSGGHVPWVSWAVVTVLVSAMGAGLLWLLWRQGPSVRSVFWPTCVPVGLAVGGVCFLPLIKARSERARGVILEYDRERQRLALPRERLSLAKEQIAEFLILEECAPRRRFNQKSRFPPAAELRVRYRGPGLKEVTLLQVAGASLLDEVVSNLRQVDLGRIRRVKEVPGQTDWEEVQL